MDLQGGGQGEEANVNAVTAEEQGEEASVI